MPSGYKGPNYNTVSYAANGEDVLLLRAFADCHQGFFVDVGAGDPEEESVTKNLVDRLDWRGVNIEPVPELLERLRSLRPNDINIGVAVGAQPGKATFYRILPAPGLEGGTGLSTLDPPSLRCTDRPAGGLRRWRWTSCRCRRSWPSTPIPGSTC